VGERIADCRLPNGDWQSGKEQLEIGNWQLAMNRPTRYREVVLTSLHSGAHPPVPDQLNQSFLSLSPIG